ncbi:lipoate--protein ligase [Ruminococcaceae bacterium OttesenSCG-928-L11]|nr:lipoate--protein ligase [Ruminococcaceae bacterium OttesenSCG-928-L11]
MKLLYNTSTDAAFNLALEEYALTRMEDDILMLWRNANAVIIGKNQNAMEEIDVDFLREHDIQLIRRQSGGGAVFHDLGNINYTLIQQMGADDFSNYAKFTKPVCDFLATLGLLAEYQGRNDILLDGMKISGNAQAAKNGRFMHHGTLLYNVDFGALAGVLRPRDVKISSKGVKSVRSRVTNIASHLKSPMDTEAFVQQLYDFFLNHMEAAEPYALTESDVAGVRQLVADKYGTWEWNFGGSPAYNFERVVKFPFGIVELRMTVQGGVIREAHIHGDFFGMQDVAGLEDILKGVRHDREAVRRALADVPLDSIISGMTVEDLAGMV